MDPVVKNKNNNRKTTFTLVNNLNKITGLQNSFILWIKLHHSLNKTPLTIQATFDYVSNPKGQIDTWNGHTLTLTQ